MRTNLVFYNCNAKVINKRERGREERVREKESERKREKRGERKREREVMGGREKRGREREGKRKAPDAYTYIIKVSGTRKSIV